MRGHFPPVSTHRRSAASPWNSSGSRAPSAFAASLQVAARAVADIEAQLRRRRHDDEIHLLPQDRRRIGARRVDDRFDQIVDLEELGDLVAVLRVEDIADRQRPQRLLRPDRDRRRMVDVAKDVDPAEMRGPEIALVECRGFQRDRIARHVAGLLGQRDHLGDEHVVPPAVLFGAEPLDQRRRASRASATWLPVVSATTVMRRISNSRAGVGQIEDRILQLPRHRIPRGQGEQLRLVLLDEPRAGCRARWRTCAFSSGAFFWSVVSRMNCRLQPFGLR